MRRLAAGAFLSLALYALPASADEPLADVISATQLLELACVKTGLGRNAFDEVAGRQGWEPIEPFDIETTSDWSTGYLLPYAAVTLEGWEQAQELAEPPVADDRIRRAYTPQQTQCSIYYQQAEENWLDDVDSIMLQYGLRRLSPSEAPPIVNRGDADYHFWTRLDGTDLVARYDRATGQLKLEFGLTPERARDK